MTTHDDERDPWIDPAALAAVMAQFRTIPGMADVVWRRVKHPADLRYGWILMHRDGRPIADEEAARADRHLDEQSPELARLPQEQRVAVLQRRIIKSSAVLGRNDEA